MINLFSRTKKPWEIQGSGYGTNYASNPTNYSSSYSAAKPTTTNQSSYFTKEPVIPQMSVAQPKVQASGYGSNYASNPTNYTPKYTPPKPQPIPTPVDPQTQSINDFLKRMSEQAAGRVDQINANADQSAELIKKRYDLAGQAIQGQTGALTDIFNRFKTNTEADIADAVAAGESQKQQVKDYYGEANRTAAQARQETGQQATRKFAAQGAIDSAGAGSYKEANANIDSEFNRVVAQNASALAAKQTDIDMAVGQYQRQAKSLIANEETKLMQALQQIQIQFADNEVAKQQAMSQVYQEAQARVYQIQDQLSSIEQQAIEQKNNIALELKKLDTTKLSPEFMATGKPTNQTEYEFLVQNADKFKTLGLLGGGTGSQMNESQVQKLSDLDASVAQLQALPGVIDKYSSLMGPVAGRVNSKNPYNTDAQAFQSQMKAVAQQVGRAMEGGVLRAEDVPKYEAILPKITDTREVALEKIKNVSAMIASQRQIAQSSLSAAGYNAIGSQVPQQNMSMASGQIVTAPDGQQVMIVD